METEIAVAQQANALLLDRLPKNADLAFGSGRMEGETTVLPVAGIDEEAIWKAFADEKCVFVSLCFEDRRFGGREEGGWWHEICDVLYQAPAFCYKSLVMLVSQFRRIETNDGRRGIGSVCSRGIFLIRISCEPVESTPTSNPRYS